MAVLFAELLKLLVCTLALVFVSGGPLAATQQLRELIWDRKMDTLIVSLPALCYTLQNNLQFLAASHLGAALLQLIYLSLMGGGFALFLAGSYPLIPNPNLTEYHKPTSFIVMCGGIWIFILASFVDPGTITAANLHRYSRLPYDQVPTHIQALPPQRHS